MDNKDKINLLALNYAIELSQTGNLKPEAIKSFIKNMNIDLKDDNVINVVFDQKKEKSPEQSDAFKKAS